jgi:hypothetical protein
MSRGRVRFQALVAEAVREPPPPIDVASRVVATIAARKSAATESVLPWWGAISSTAIALAVLLIGPSQGILFGDPFVGWFLEDPFAEWFRFLVVVMQ